MTRMKTECDCYDVHYDLDLTEDTCGCPCHRKLTTEEQQKIDLVKGLFQRAIEAHDKIDYD